MNARFLLLPLIALVLACSGDAPAGTTGAADAAADPIALAVAGAAGKPVLVMYSSETCGCCARMDEETFADPDVKAAMEKLTFVRVTRGKDAAAFEKRWAKAGTPSFVVLDSEGQAKGGPQRGPFDAGEFLFLLDWIADPSGPPPTINRLPDGCGGRGGGEAAEGEEGGCGGCGDETEGDAADAGCGGCSDG